MLHRFSSERTYPCRRSRGASYGDSSRPGGSSCSICYKMLVTLAIFAAFALLLLLMGWAGAESRPDFVDPTKKHGPFVTPIRVDWKDRP